MKIPLSTGLCLLEFRRAAWRVLVPTGAFLGAVLALRSGPAPGLPFGDAAANRGLFREEAWIATLLLLIPLAVFRAARIPALWRTGEADWIGPRPISRSEAVVSTWAGLLLALALGVLATGVWIESRIDGDHPAPVFVGSHPLPEVLRLDPGTKRDISIPRTTLRDRTETPNDGARTVRARVRLTVVPGGDPTSRVRMKAKGGSRPSERLVDGRTWLEVDCGVSPGSVDLELENLGAGHIVCLATPGVEFWESGGREDRSWFPLATRAALGLLWATALAFGFATWIGSLTAATTVLALWLGLSMVPGTPSWLTSTSIPLALGILGEARVPGSVHGTAAIVTGAIVSAAFCLAQLGLRSWRHAP